jgi:uncharacterized protein
VRSQVQVTFPLEQVAELCRRYQVRELSVFGSAARGQLRPESDIDLLVEFEAEASVGFLRLAEVAEAFSDLLERHVDLVPKNGLKPLLRPHVLAEARLLYAA